VGVSALALGMTVTRKFLEALTHIRHGIRRSGIAQVLDKETGYLDSCPPQAMPNALVMTK